MKTLLKKLMGDKAGASAAEYALILAIVGAGIVAGLGGFVTDFNTTMDNALPAAAGGN